MSEVAVAFIFFFNDTATTEIYTLSLHDALPIYQVIQYKIIIDPFLIHPPTLSLPHSLLLSCLPSKIGRAHV